MKVRAKDYLKRYERANDLAMRCKAEYEAEELKIDSVRSSADLDGMPHAHGVTRPAEEKILRLAEKKQKWIDAELEAIKVRQEVFELIYDIPGVEGTILIERYINLRHWEEICILIHYSWTQTHEHHKRALRLVQDRIEPN